MPQAAQVIGGRESGGPRSDDQNALAAVRCRRQKLPALSDCLIPEKSLDRIDPDRLVNLGAIAGSLAWVIADAAHHRRERIVLREDAPRVLVIAGFGVRQPILDVLARRAGVIARRQAIHIDRPGSAPGACVIEKTRAGIEADRKRVFHQASPS